MLYFRQSSLYPPSHNIKNRSSHLKATPSSSFRHPYFLDISIVLSARRGMLMFPRPPCFLGVFTLKAILAEGQGNVRNLMVMVASGKLSKSIHKRFNSLAKLL